MSSIIKGVLWKLIPSGIASFIKVIIRAIRGTPLVDLPNNTTGNTSLHDAIENNDMKAFDKYKTYKLMINSQNMIGFTPLMSAAYKRNRVMVEELLKNGADKTIIGKSGHRAYTIAADIGEKELAELLRFDIPEVREI